MPTSKPAAMAEYTIALPGATYYQRQRGLNGAVHVALMHGHLGDRITVDPQEAARLSQLGALAPPETTREQLQGEMDARREAYRRARRELPETA